MRKKELLLQIEKILKINQELFFDNKILTERLKENEAVINNLNGKISSLNDEIDNLKSQFEEIKNTTISNANSYINDDVTPVEDDFIILDTPVVELSEGTNFEKATEAIGKVVLKCADICEEFASLDNINSKDLINLALGRTEVFKSEVLNIVNNSAENENIDIILNEKMQVVLDYFELLYGQINWYFFNKVFV